MPQPREMSSRVSSDSQDVKIITIIPVFRSVGSSLLWAKAEHRRSAGTRRCSPKDVFWNIRPKVGKHPNILSWVALYSRGGMSHNGGNGRGWTPDMSRAGQRAGHAGDSPRGPHAHQILNGQKDSTRRVSTQGHERGPRLGSRCSLALGASYLGTGPWTRTELPVLMRVRFRCVRRTGRQRKKTFLTK